MRESKPSVLIIGGGIAGLAAGCYAQMSGMDSHVLEKHVLPGGCCTAWSREGYIFDYCIEWLIGTAPGNEANQIWRELGALDGKEITNFDTFNRVVGEDGREVRFYHDPGRLERHLRTISPDDARRIKSFCRDLRRFLKLDVFPFLKPPPLKTLPEKLAMVREVLPAFLLFWRTSATQMTDFSGRFTDSFLGRALPNVFFQDHERFPLLPYLYNLACAHHGNAGFPEGGSLGLARSIENRYAALGGRISYRARARRILVEDGRAVGVELKDGSRHYADHVISACDGYTTIYRLLGGEYTSPTLDKLYEELLHEPGTLYPGVVSAFVGVDGEPPPETPHSTTFLLSEEDSSRLPGAMRDSIVVQLRSRYWRGCAPPGKSLFHCTYFSDFGYWRELRTRNRREYWAQKKEVADFTRRFLVERYPGVDGRIEIVDVATPTTNHRYTGNHNGSILAWIGFTEADDLVTQLVNRQRMRLPGLDGFSMAGQWVVGGGLIRAASSGRFAVQFLCEELGIPFRAWESPDDVRWRPEMLGHLPQLDVRPMQFTEEA
ncbi:Phytoene dehydrogenase-related protein [Saccharopolyspora antimicrobica]|uniref:Phytoene dehydrogenase-like protein n=1 Tax=Saccharopolyspora antimicrobica TaxID=455193 RepID=A0A1I5CSN7_9PSEU|nr:NAD(P)/FAD-dependent oxidoreductase [Saccharopolyspora antimicrobica]RKT88759.1 phytoene dehydrogenase-like protein [Saccharopolyspora antimicrobica]SFN89937.1 Phytoene dehydrogenase-related protein [Saccharopolyspora antimicrobica]